MKTHVRLTAAALILLGATTACSRTTEGSVAMTTEPGPPLTETTRAPSSPTLPGLPNIPIPDIQIPGLPGTDVPEVPAPPNATTMACSEYNDLDEATKRAVIRAILGGESTPPGPEAEITAQLIADAMCQFMPEAEVNEVVIGIPIR